MGNVLKRIERHIGPFGHEKAILDKTRQIERTVMSYHLTTHENKGLDVVKGAMTAYQEAQGRKSAEARENLEIHLTAYLFAQNRKMFERKNGAGSMDNYDVDKEIRQIEAVVRALGGEHGQIGTGEGKTSVILPITTIIKSITDPGQKVTFSSDSMLRVGEFEKFTKPFLEKLRQDGVADIALKGEEERPDKGKDRRNAVTAHMEKEALFDGKKTYTEETKGVLQKEYWQSLFQSGMDEKGKKTEEAKGPVIEAVTHGDIMRRYMRNEEEFKKDKTPIYMDEAHAPFDRGTPTQIISESLVFSPEQVRRATADWVLHYIVGQSLSEKDITRADGIGTTIERSRKSPITLDTIRKKGHPTHRLFKEAIKKIGETYKIDSEARMEALEKTMMRSIQDTFKGTTSERNELFGYTVESMREEVAKVYYMNSDAFVTTPEGKLVIRDAYQDELLLTHQYNRDTELAVRGLSGLFKVVLPKRASGSKKYPSLLKDAAGRVTCFSGTLLDEGKKTQFADFLESTTKQSIFDLENPNKKTIPPPVVDQNSGQATNSLIKSIRADQRGALIIDATTVDHAEETYRKFTAQYGSDLVRYIGPKPTGNIAEEQRYEALVKEYTDELAQGKIKILVSTGSMGVGMNIIQPNGKYPDIKIGILGIPKSKLQLKQILGRRRAPDSTDKVDFHWHLGKDQFMEYVSFYQKEENGLTDAYQRALGTKKLQGDIMNEFAAAGNDQEAMKKIVLDVMKNREQRKSSDFQYQIEYDQLHADAVAYCERYLTQKVLTDVLKKKQLGRSIPENIAAHAKSLTPQEKTTLATLVQTIGIPSSLYHELTLPMVGVPLSVSDRSMRSIDLVRKKMMDQSFLDQEMNRWISQFWDAGIWYNQEVIEPFASLINKEGFHPGVFSFMAPVPEEYRNQSFRVVPGVITPTKSYPIVRTELPNTPLEEGRAYPFSLATAAGQVYDLHPIFGGAMTHGISHKIGERVEVTQFPIRLENGGDVFLYRVPIQ